MVVEENLLAEAVVPQAQHHVNQQFAGHVLTDNDRAWHAQVMVGVRAVVQRRQGQVDRCAPLGGVAPHAFQNLADVEGVGGAGQVRAVKLGAADGDENDVVLAPVLLDLPTHGRLDIRTGLAPLDRRGDAVLGQDVINLGIAGFPDFLLEPANRVVFKEQIRLVRGQQSFW